MYIFAHVYKKLNSEYFWLKWGEQKGHGQLCSRPGLGRGSGAPSSPLGPHVLLSAWHLMGIDYIFAE